MEHQEHLVRPQAPQGPSERVRAWITWFGPGRLVGSALATVVVCVGAFWLVRSPVPPTEAALPRATLPAVSASGAAANGPGPDAAGADAAGPDAAGPDAAGADGAVTPPAGSAPAVGAVGSTVVVHVAGAVVAPGVHLLAPGARVADAVAAAGGPVPEADLDGLNLAAVVVDGGQVRVPLVGETVVPVGADVAATPTGPIDVNRATVEQLDTLPGVGPATALAIVTERERNGPYLGVDDLERVPGIGPAKLAALRDLVTA